MQIGLSTSIVAACSFAIVLKVLHLFDLIKWSPVGFVKKWKLENVATFEKWLLLLLFLFVAAILLYFICTLISIRPSVVSLILGCLIAVLAEWTIFRYPLEAASFKKLSIPFIVIVIITLRFIIETASFARNNLVR